MRKLLIGSIIAMGLTGCGIAEDLSTACGSDIEIICKMVFGESEGRIEDLENRADLIEQRLEQLDHFISLIEDSTDLNKKQLDQLQLIANNIQLQVTELQEQDNIVELIDPCGDGAGYDEVLLKTESGKLVAYFEQGGNRFLTVLTNGAYRTTDQQACAFSVLDGQVIY